MRASLRPIVVKFGIFALVMTVLTACLFVIFGQYTSGSTKAYSAVFADVSRLKPGDSVRIAGMRVGTVDLQELVGEVIDQLAPRAPRHSTCATSTA